ncbi:MAG: ThiF family adenylyltransferase, partial [Gammaproteobacteria bacterium]|nr:ThiF family adenylyltransferase [Gammaproteobacteria bacterium]
MNANLSYFPKLRRHSLPNRDWANAPGNANVFRPNIYDPAQPDDQTALAELLDSGPLWQVHDTLPAQLEELAKSRHPRHKKMVDSSALVRNEIDEIVADCALEQFGRWIHYPWSGRLIRVLPPAEFRELRLDRNRNKLTHGEQQTLGKLRVGVVGLSVGNAIARAIALEGTCGALKLADHDHLELSNLNRIQAGLEHLDLPKPVIAARQILELDPYLDVSVVPEGLNDDNIEAFFDAPGLDLLIEECDDLRVKVALREHARRRQIPVFMETSDRGMLDVERFDQEPSRALLHGLLGPIGASDIPKPLTNDDKVKFALPFFGPSTLSPRMAASMLEIEESISSWPQLGGDVLLGGATVAAAVRAFGLNQPLQSGRRWVDLNRLISEPPAAGATLGESVDESTHLSDTQVARLVGAGTAAPSGGNSQ